MEELDRSVTPATASSIEVERKLTRRCLPESFATSFVDTTLFATSWFASSSADQISSNDSSRDSSMAEGSSWWRTCRSLFGAEGSPANPCDKFCLKCPLVLLLWSVSLISDGRLMNDPRLSLSLTMKKLLPSNNVSSFCSQKEEGSRSSFVSQHDEDAMGVTDCIATPKRSLISDCCFSHAKSARWISHNVVCTSGSGADELGIMDAKEDVGGTDFAGAMPDVKQRLLE